MGGFSVYKTPVGLFEHNSSVLSTIWTNIASHYKIERWYVSSPHYLKSQEKSQVLRHPQDLLLCYNTYLGIIVTWPTLVGHLLMHGIRPSGHSCVRCCSRSNSGIAEPHHSHSTFRILHFFMCSSKSFFKTMSVHLL